MVKADGRQEVNRRNKLYRNGNQDINSIHVDKKSLKGSEKDVADRTSRAEGLFPSYGITSNNRRFDCYETKEIRWFFKEANTSIEKWFANLDFETSENREDLYLQLKKEDVGVKLRNGNIEVKHRTGTRARGCSGQQAWGYFEHWIKWSFEAGNHHGILSGMTDEEGEKWVSVEKERRSAKLTEKDGKVATLSPIANLESGCQIEYTNIRVLGQNWYTFSLEWFGQSCIDLNESLIQNILGSTELAIKNSMGYPSFLSKLKSKQRELSLFE